MTDKCLSVDTALLFCSSLLADLNTHSTNRLFHPPGRRVGFSRRRAVGERRCSPAASCCRIWETEWTARFRRESSPAVIKNSIRAVEIGTKRMRQAVPQGDGRYMRSLTFVSPRPASLAGPHKHERERSQRINQDRNEAKEPNVFVRQMARQAQRCSPTTK